MIYIASLKKYVGKVQEDILTCEHLMSVRGDVKIKDFYEIETIATKDDIIMLKSIWGYHENPNKFITTLKKLEKNKVKLINDYKYVYWNIDKYKYLQELAYIGVVPTYLLPPNKMNSIGDIHIFIDDICRKNFFPAVVVKPAISASGFLTNKYRFKKNNTEILKKIYENKEIKFIIQPYRPSISRGEISLVILNGNQCYGIHRFPGILKDKKEPLILPIESVPDNIKDMGEQVFIFFKKRFHEIPSICRIDFVKYQNKYEIIEVELIDPSLSFRELPDSLREYALNLFLFLI